MSTDTTTPEAVRVDAAPLALRQPALPTGVRVVASDNPLAEAVALARSLRADLASTAIEAELAIDRRRRAAEASALRRRASEATRLAELIAGTEPDADEALLECAAELHTLAAGPDPMRHVDAVREAAASRREARERYRSAVQARDRTREALDHATARLTAHPSQSITSRGRSETRAVAAKVQAAAERVRASQRAIGPRPQLDDAGRREVQRAVSHLDRANHRAATLGRRTVLVLVQATGLGLVAAGYSMSQQHPPARSTGALLLPLVIAGLWLVRQHRSVRQQLAAARRAATALTLRLFPGAVPQLAANAGRDDVIDPLETYQRLQAEWEAGAADLAAANAELERALTVWAGVAGPADPDHLDEVFALADAIDAANERLTHAEAQVRAADSAVTTARETWHEVLDAAGYQAATTDDAGAVLEDLRVRYERRAAARERLETIAAAEARADARARLTGLLTDRSLEALVRAAERTGDGADLTALDRPLVIADPGPPATGSVRRRTLRRLLGDLRGAAPVVVVAPEAVADEWGCPRVS